MEIIIKSIFMALYIASFLFFLLVLFVQDPTADYYEQISQIDKQHTAFSSKHFSSFIVYYIMFIISIMMVFIFGRNMPPLIISLCIVFITIGMILNLVILIQYFDIDNSGNFFYLYYYIRYSISILIWRNDTALLAHHHIMNIILSVYLLINLIKKEKKLSAARIYKNKILNLINNVICRNYFIGAFVLLFPVFIIITLILLLFGQEMDSIVKVWTETTTWTFSQYDHPPFLTTHEGHYLCTVAACGHPNLVKPLRLGIRHGKIIIVNRQLLIANAYEAMIQRYFPRFHRFIRNIYNRYGYPLSKHISNKYISDVIYILMKPLEWVFLLNLYLFVIKPEELIGNQYK